MYIKYTQKVIITRALKNQAKFSFWKSQIISSPLCTLYSSCTAFKNAIKRKINLSVKFPLWNQRLKDPQWKPWSTKDANITLSSLQWALIYPFRKPDFHRKGAEVINLVLLGSLRGKNKTKFHQLLFINSFMLLIALLLDNVLRALINILIDYSFRSI